MNFKKICLFSLLLILIFSNLTYANIDENEQIDLNQIKQEVVETSTNTSSIPDINSKAAIVIDRSTRTILYGKNEQEIRKMASTTKIMTAIVVIENANLYDTVTISKKAANTGGSALGIREGDKITICDLLYGLLLKSGNDTAVALAENVGGSIEGFAEMMNKKAQELQLNNTNFVTPHGLDNDSHYTTAYELAILTNYALNNQTFYNLVSSKSYTITINGTPKTISNTNELLGNLNGVYGVKTGFTNGANRCLVTACKRDNMDIICVVLGADTKKFRTQDSIKLIEYVFKNYQMINLKQIANDTFNEWRATNLNKFSIKKGLSNNLELEIEELSYDLYPVKKEDVPNISTAIECDYNLSAPVEIGYNIATLCIKVNEISVIKYNIVNSNNIEKKNTLNYFLEFLSNWFYYLTINY